MINQFKLKSVAMLCVLATVCSAKKLIFTTITSIDPWTAAPSFAAPEEVPAGHLKNDITYNQAAFLLQNFLTTSAFYTTAVNDGFSGFLSKQTLNRIVPVGDANQTTTGLLVYLCYDKNNANGGKVFLAYKHGTGFTDVMNVPVINNSDVFYRTNFNLYYTGTQNPSLEDIKAELVKNIEVDSTENDTIMGSSVIKYTAEFKTTFEAKDDVSNQDVECNNYSFGFIPLNELNLLRFPSGINQDNFMGIRFYFGFDNTEPDNRIRVFFVGSFANGNIIIPKSGSDPKTIYGRIIERSRP